MARAENCAAHKAQAQICHHHPYGCRGLPLRGERGHEGRVIQGEPVHDEAEREDAQSRETVAHARDADIVLQGRNAAGASHTVEQRRHKLEKVSEHQQQDEHRSGDKYPVGEHGAPVESQGNVRKGLRGHFKHSRYE